MARKPTVSTVIFLLSPFLALPVILKDIHNRKKGSLFLFACFIGVLAYLYLPSIGQDGADRYILYHKFKSLSLHEFIYGYLVYRADYIYYSLIYLFASLGIKFQLLLFLLATFNAYVPLFLFKKITEKQKFTKNRYFILFTFVVLTYSLTFLFSGVRNNIAFSFVFLGFYYLFFEKRKILPYTLLAIGIITHFSMVVYLPIFLVARRVSLKFLGVAFIFLLIVSFLLPSNFIQSAFLSVDTGSKIYNAKIAGYAGTKLSPDSTTLTIIAKVIGRLWFYFSLLYVMLNLRTNSNNPFYRSYILFSLPVLLFIAFPGISGRYMFGVKMFFVLLLISDHNKKNNDYWKLLFFLLLIFQPLYDTFRLLTDNFVAGFISMDNMTLFQILTKTYTYKSMLH